MVVNSDCRDWMKQRTKDPSPDPNLILQHCRILLLFILPSIFVNEACVKALLLPLFLAVCITKHKCTTHTTKYYLRLIIKT